MNRVVKKSDFACLFWDVLLVLRINGFFHPYKSRLFTPLQVPGQKFQPTYDHKLTIHFHPAGQHILLMAEILHHLGCMIPYKSWDKLPINWLAGFQPSTVGFCAFVLAQPLQEALSLTCRLDLKRTRPSEINLWVLDRGFSLLFIKHII